MKKRFKGALFLNILVWAYDCSAIVDRYGLEETPEDILRSIPAARVDLSAPIETTSYLPMTPIKDQGRLGTCASFAAGACVEYWTQQKTQQYTPVSEAEFTVHAEQQDDCRFGINLGKALVIAQQDGFIHQKHWPYEDFLESVPEGSDDACIAYPRGLKRDTLNHYKVRTLSKISTSTRASLAVSVRQSLREPMRVGARARSSHSQPEESFTVRTIQQYLYGYKTPIAVSVPIFDAKAWNKAEHGVIPIPSRALVEKELHVLDSPFDRWHAVVLTGYDRENGYLRFRNSWGEDWGNDGYGWLPNSYMQYATDIFVTQGAVIDLPQKPVSRSIPQVPYVLPLPVGVSAYYARPGAAGKSLGYTYSKVSQTLETAQKKPQSSCQDGSCVLL